MAAGGDGGGAGGAGSEFGEGVFVEFAGSTGDSGEFADAGFFDDEFAVEPDHAVESTRDLFQRGYVFGFYSGGEDRDCFNRSGVGRDFLYSGYSKKRWCQLEYRSVAAVHELSFGI